MIEVRGLRKQYGRVIALDGVDARFEAGSICGIVGPNSAGKTTLLKILLGLVRPDSGTVTMADVRLDGDIARRTRVGYMRQTPTFPGNLSAAELLRMLQGLRPGAAADESLIEELRLESQLAKPLRALSGGTLQKVNAAIAFLFDPAVLILDEPTAGLDPYASRVLKQRVRRARDAGRTILLTSHVIAELHDLADRLLVLVEGQVRFTGSTAELTATTGGSTMEDALARLLDPAAEATLTAPAVGAVRR